MFLIINHAIQRLKTLNLEAVGAAEVIIDPSKNVQDRIEFYTRDRFPLMTVETKHGKGEELLKKILHAHDTNLGPIEITKNGQLVDGGAKVYHGE